MPPYRLPPDDIVAMTILAGESPCLICGLAMEADREGLFMTCEWCDIIAREYDGYNSFGKYRDQENGPRWFKRIRAYGTMK